MLRWEGIPSPDGKWFVQQDKNNRLFLLNLASKEDKQIVQADPEDNSGGAFSSIRWSPDSRWILFSKDAANDFAQLFLYSLDSGKTIPITTDRYNSSSADWSADGKWIYFLSDRALHTVVQSPWGDRQPDPFFDRSNKVYALALRKGLISPFEPADELHPASDAEKPNTAANPAKAAKTAPPKVEIDTDGLESRLWDVPVRPGNYSDLQAAAKRLCWLDHSADEPAKNSLQCVDIANKGDAPETLLEGVKSFEISGDRKKMLVHVSNDLFVFDSALKADALKSPKGMADARVNLGAWTFSVIPADEYREAFQDAWRLHRDYFYDPHMHGVSWPAMRDKYGELIGRVRDREELSDLIADMVSELSRASHVCQRRRHTERNRPD